MEPKLYVWTFGRNLTPLFLCCLAGILHVAPFGKGSTPLFLCWCPPPGMARRARPRPPPWRKATRKPGARSCRAWRIVRRPRIPRARVRQQGHSGLLQGGWLKTADAASGPPYATGQGRWPPRPHSSRTDSGFENYRTVPAQPHNPAQLFLPIIAQRCKKVLALRGKPLYIRV